MGHWDDIPDDLVPDPEDLAKLHVIVAQIREAVKVRHDLEEALSRSSGGHRLGLRPFESTIGKTTNSIDPKTYEKEHERLAAQVMSVASGLKTQELRDFLTKGPGAHSARIKRFLPDIAGGPKGRYLPTVKIC